MKFFLFFLLLVIVGCRVQENGDSGEAFVFDKSSEEMQKARAKVIEDFLEQPTLATNRYSAEWTELQPATDKIQLVRRLAMSGQLMEHDPKNYERYYAFVGSYVTSRDPELAEVAISALSGAKGRESIDILAAHILERTRFARSAAIALENRYQMSKYDPTLIGDLERLQLYSREICEIPVPDYLGRYCGLVL